MADYQIQIGTKLDTSGINTGLKSYKGDVKVGTILDTEGITKALTSYKTKPIEIESTLNMQGIESAISNYGNKKNRKTIKLGIEPDFTGVNAKIESYDANPLKVKVELNWTGIAGQINNFKTTEKIKLDAELNKSAISSAINEFNKAINAAESKTKIKIKAEPDLKSLGSKISKHEVTQKLKIHPKLLVSEIGTQINDFNSKNKRYIYLKAKLTDGAVAEAISTYKTSNVDKLKIPIDLTLEGTTDFDTQLKGKIKFYEGMPVTIPVKLEPSKSGFTSNITKTPISLDTTLNPDGINRVIEKFKPRSKVNVDVKLVPKDINAEVRSLTKPTESLEIGAKLDGKKINEDIALFQPTATLGIKPDLIIEDVEDQIMAYMPKTPLRVNVKIDEKDIAGAAKKQGAQEAIQVNVRLNPDKLNEQIKTFKTTSKISVGIKLDPKGLAEQIKKIQPKTKIKIGVQIDPDDVARQVGKVKTNTPIRLGVELDPNAIRNVENRINNLRQKIQNLGNVSINIGGSAGAGTGGGKGQDIQTVRIARSVDDVTRAYRQLLSIQQRIGSKQQTAAKLDTSKNAHEILELSNQIDNLYGRYQRLHSLFSSQFNPIQVDTLNKNFEVTAEKLSVIKQKALDAKDSLDRMGTSSNASGASGVSGNVKGQVDEITQSYNELMRVLNELNSKKLQLNKLDASSPESSNKIQTLRLQIEQLDNEYNNLLASFNSQGIQFTAQQWNNIESAMAKVGRQINVVQAGMADKSVIQNQTQAYKELLAISKEIGSLEVNIAKLKNQGGNANQIATLENQLRTLQSTYQQLVTTMDTPLTADQWSTIYTQIAKTSEEVQQLNAKHSDMRAEFAKEIRGNLSGYDAKVRELEKDMGRLSDATPEVRIGIEKVEAALKRMYDAADDNSLIEAENEYQRELKETLAQLKINQSVEDKDLYGDTFEIKKAAALERLKGLFEEGSQASKRFGVDAQKLRTELDQVGNVKGIDNVNRKIGALEKKIKSANVQTQTFSTRLKEQFSKYTQYFSVASVFMYSFQAARNMFEQVKLIDSAMTELKKVTDETDASYNQFLSRAAQRSKELGTTIDGLVASTADFARLGYSFEDSQGLAEVANIYAVVGDEIEGVEGATESLISTMAAFKDDMTGMSNTDIAMSIIDTYNELGKLIAYQHSNMLLESGYNG
jgi:hypothetical protein